MHDCLVLDGFQRGSLYDSSSQVDDYVFAGLLDHHKTTLTFVFQRWLEFLLSTFPQWQWHHRQSTSPWAARTQPNKAYP